MNSSSYYKTYDKGYEELRKEGITRLIVTVSFYILIIVCALIVIYLVEELDLLYILIFLSLFNCIYFIGGIRSLRKAKKKSYEEHELRNARKLLINFKQGLIQSDILDDYMNDSFAEFFYRNPIILEYDDLILFIKYKISSPKRLLDWAHYIWFSDFYSLDNKTEEVIKELEEAYQANLPLPVDYLEKTLEKLEVNK
ncbi:hypothetical protein [Vallitalea okinawensis]|uniref:hypothetical protein n=1 Tax=Vallitalea okinawensis TaxID=2078660 RepID=UPI000CFD2084|nr:hypothetical protein [Vallitalea okinawensis]